MEDRDLCSVGIYHLEIRPNQEEATMVVNVVYAVFAPLVQSEGHVLLVGKVG